MKLLIMTEPDDLSATAVKLAFQQLGYTPTVFFSADMPTQQTHSVTIDKGEYRWQREDAYSRHTENNYDIVWWRQPRKPYLPKDLLPANDMPFVCAENRLFFEYLMQQMSPGAWWINTRQASLRANTKLTSLRVADACGLAIPTTLSSNNPEAIRAFVARHEEDGVIYKSFSSDQQLKRIILQDLPQDKFLQWIPGIFQKEVEKSYAIRIICFGDYYVVAKLLLPMRVEPHYLPPPIEQAVRRFMKKMGLVFGTCDLIVTPEGEYFFVEVHEQGSFLWLEEMNSGFKMLDIFIQFLLSCGAPFTWQIEACQFSLKDFIYEAEALQVFETERHLCWNNIVKRACS